MQLARLIGQHLEDGMASSVMAPLSGLLLDMRVPDLYAVDWESAVRTNGLPQWNVTRFCDESDARMLEPQSHPPRMLLATPWTPGQPEVNSLRYFKLYVVRGLDSDEVIATLRGNTFEIAHLCVFALQRDNQAPVLAAKVDDAYPRQGLRSNVLARAIAACEVRMLVLQAADRFAYPLALDTAHHLQRVGGPTTLVVESRSLQPFDTFYLNLVHNFDISSAMGYGWPGGPERRALFCRIGGSSVLQIAPLADEFARQQLANAETLDLLSQQLATDESMHSDIAQLQTKLRSTAIAAREYGHESGAWTPLDDDLRDQRDTAVRIQTLQRTLGRVVNVGLFEGGQQLRSRSLLRPRERYELTVQIGRPAQWSLVEDAQPLDEARLEHLYKDEGVALRVHVFAPAFEIDVAEHTLMLPPPPSESRVLRIGLRAPAEAGRHSIRVGVYHQNNLLQSVLVRVETREKGKARRRDGGVKAEVEFALSATLLDAQRLPARSLNILTNGADDGTHSLVIVSDAPGQPLRRQFDFGESAMGGAAREARKALYAIAADASTKPPTYRFDLQTNGTDLARFEKDLLQLADLGSELYTNIVTGEDRAFEAALTAALPSAGARIQVSVTKSAQYVFPWALVYDHDYVSGAQHLCPDFKAAAQGPRPPDWAQQHCFAQGCAHRGDPSVVCPSGFWGFKHLIEQPLSVAAAAEAKDPRDLVLEMHGGASNNPMNALMAVSRELEQVRRHETELRTNTPFAYIVKDTKVEVWQHMKDAAQAGLHLIYFYCHGGRDASRVWLGVGKGPSEHLQPRDLLRIDWAGLHPLVFINGCHTADVTPDDLLHFTRMFAWCRAAGLIGTEISVPEELARHFARGFLAGFAGGRGVGEVMREQRLELLELGNLLGLAYTPYCSADLRIVRP